MMSVGIVLGRIHDLLRGLLLLLLHWLFLRRLLLHWLRCDLREVHLGREQLGELILLHIFVFLGLCLDVNAS